MEDIMDRRSFIASGIAAGVAMTSVISTSTAKEISKGAGKGFKLKYAPSLSCFKHHAGKDPIDNIRFIGDQGFRAIFDNRLMKKPADLQKKIASTLKKSGMDLGPFVGFANFKEESFVLDPSEVKDGLVKNARECVEVRKRTGAKWVLVVPGRYNQRLEWDYQTANVIENLKYCSEICQKAGLVIVLEPLNQHNHPGLFLTKMPQSYQICKAVNSPSCKIVDDVYHQQITEGNLIPNIDRCWSEIAAFHLGDNPGRKEPGTGEINFKNIFKHISKKGFDGVLCMEHGNSIKGKEGELALIEAYRKADSF